MKNYCIKGNVRKENINKNKKNIILKLCIKPKYSIYLPVFILQLIGKLQNQ
jgi:hypothetical protein